MQTKYCSKGHTFQHKTLSVQRFCICAEHRREAQIGGGQLAGLRGPQGSDITLDNEKAN